MSFARWLPVPLVLVLLLGAAGPGSGAEGILEGFPIVVHAGLGEAAEGEAPSARTLPDLPFSNERGYGYVGGTSRKGVPIGSAGCFVRGGNPDWPLTWREGMDGYAFRVPRGRYVVELSFVETELAHPGLRVFDVVSEGSTLLEGVDVAAWAGDFAWLTLRGAVSVLDGWLDLAFRTVPGSRPPIVSRIRISAGVPAEPPEAPTLTLRGGIGSNLLGWTSSRGGAIAGFEVSRSAGSEGPFVPLTTDPVRTEWFEDGRAELGKRYWYVVRAVDVAGRKGPPSAPATAAASSAGELGLKVYQLLVPTERLGELRTRSIPAARVPGELAYLGAVFPVEVSLDTSGRGWREKKSYVLEVGRDGRQALGRRRTMRLEAEAGDPTRLGAFVSARAADALGIATPALEPIALLLNGRFEGLYFDVEPAGEGFRRRARLDTVGLMALRTRSDALAPSWDPYGDGIGEEGNIWSLTELVHELNALGDAEVRPFFEEALYLDRWLDRAVLMALLGERDRGDALDVLLRDSRNGRWELFPGRSETVGESLGESVAPRVSTPPPAGDAGGAPEVRRWLYGSSLAEGVPPAGDAFVFESRFFHDADLRRTFHERARSRLEGPLSSEGFRGTVQAAFAAIRRAAEEDAALWPATTSEESVLSGPRRIMAAFEDRSARIRAFLAEESEGAGPQLVFEEVLLSPREGDPFLEVRNASTSPLSLGDYTLAKAPTLGDVSGRRPVSAKEASVPAIVRVRLPAKSLGPGERIAIALTEGETFRVDPGERVLALYRGGEAPAPEARPVDFVVLGHPTRGIAYGRLPGPGTRWACLSTPTPGAPNAGEELLPPPRGFQHGCELAEGGTARVWFRARAVGECPPAAKPVSVHAFHRAEGDTEYRVTELTWDERAFRHVASIDRGVDPRRISYYFVATSASGVERPYPLVAPVLTYAIPVLPQVKINEVLPRPAQEPGAPGEFVELFNASDVEVSLDGYHLTDTKRNPAKWRIPVGATIPPKGFLVILADGLNEGLHASFKLSNAGEYLGLFGRMEEGNLPVDSMAFLGMKMGESWGALPDGSKNFRSWKDPTPGKRNVPRIPKKYLQKEERPQEPPEGPAREPPPPEEGSY